MLVAGISKQQTHTKSRNSLIFSLIPGISVFTSLGGRAGAGAGEVEEGES